MRAILVAGPFWPNFDSAFEREEVPLSGLGRAYNHAPGIHVDIWETAVAEATLPANDLERAKNFYTEQLGLTATSQDATGIHFIVGGTRFRLFRSGGSASGSHTQLALIVNDITAQLVALRSRGVTFEEYDYPNLKTVDGVADLGYARAAWFKDSEGNLLGIAQLTSTT